MNNLKIDPEFQSLIFPLTDSEKEGLETSLLAEGCRDALVAWQGILLDGHHRLEICRKHNIEFETKEIELEDRTAAKIWILNNQLARRNLTPFQRAEIALRLKPLIAEKAKEKQKEAGGAVVQKSGKAVIKTDRELASVAGVSHDTIWKAEKILASKPDEKILHDLRQGEKTIHFIWKEIDLKEKREKKESESQLKRKKLLSNIDIRNGDFKEVLEDLKDIDFIVTDPPYAEKHLYLYSELSKFASEKLKKDGFIAVYSGQYHLPEAIQRLSEYLTYVWTFCLYHKGTSQLVNYVNIMCGWKPILIFSKGNKKLTGYDVLISEEREKYDHKWQQSESGVQPLIEILSKPGDLVVDPFAGSGTFLKVAHELKRNAIGAEIS